MKHKCNLIVPGFPKSGTSSLHEYLNQHPAICMSKTKEPHYFSSTNSWIQGIEFHNSLFDGCGRSVTYYGESSTTYCICNKAIDRIDSSLDTPKIIFILRHPVERLISHYKWLFALGLEKRPIMKAVEESGYSFDPDSSIQGNYFAYTLFSSYTRFLPIWETRFGLSNVAVIGSEQLLSEPSETLNNLFLFLGLPKLQNTSEVQVNLTKKITPKIRKSARVVKSFTPEKTRAAVLKLKTLKKFWDAYKTPRIEEPKVSNEDIMTLSKMFSTDTTYYLKKISILSNQKHKEFVDG